jgi:hypothetical protein
VIERNRNALLKGEAVLISMLTHAKRDLTHVESLHLAVLTIVYTISKDSSSFKITVFNLAWINIFYIRLFVVMEYVVISVSKRCVWRVSSVLNTMT